VSSITSPPAAGRDAVVRLDLGGGAVAEYRLSHWYVESRVETIDITSFTDMPYGGVAGRTEIVLRGTIGHSGHTQRRAAQDDAEAMADAVYAGDWAAAVMLADEVRERHVRGEKYVPRERLLALVRKLARQAEVIEEFGCEGLHDGHDLTYVPRVLVTVGDCREAAEIVRLEGS
jgi:hypothetical protein